MAYSVAKQLRAWLHYESGVKRVRIAALFSIAACDGPCIGVA
jgi:hypothetical protein